MFGEGTWFWNSLKPWIPEACQADIAVVLGQCACKGFSLVPPVVPTAFLGYALVAGLAIGVFLGPLIDGLAVIRGNVERVRRGEGNHDLGDSGRASGSGSTYVPAQTGASADTSSSGIADPPGPRVRKGGVNA
jgi:hypothetical protein